MPEKYHIETKPVPPRRPRIGKCGVVEWREDCAGCRNCVKKACVFDRYRQETKYIAGLENVDGLFSECMGCFSCVQQCTKGILALAQNPAYERLGNSYWTPEIIQTTWNQAETAKIPVSGAGYRGKFSGTGFDTMWTDMSEIVRPTRDGIHGREYISTLVDIGRKPSLLIFNGNELATTTSPFFDIPMPLIIDLMRPEYRQPTILPVMLDVAARTGILMIVDYRDRELLGADSGKSLSQVAFYLDGNSPLPPAEILQKTRLVEISDEGDTDRRIRALKEIHPGIVVAVRVALDARGVARAIELGSQPECEVLHLVADMNGNQIGAAKPRFIKDMVREVHKALVKSGRRDEITIIAGGGIALAEHLVKQMLCGADVISIDLPMLIALECQLCNTCQTGPACPARIDQVDRKYGAGRMINLIAAWHDQLVEVMGAMGIRDTRRLRGEVGRAMFFNELEEETFGKLFGSRKEN